MKSRDGLIQKIVNHISNNFCSMPVILSPIEADNESILLEIEQSIEISNQKSIIIPMVSAKEFQNELSFNKKVASFLKSSGYFIKGGCEDFLLNSASKSLFWKNAKDFLALDKLNSIIFFIKDVSVLNISIDEIVDIFTNMRKFCSEWNDTQLSIHFVSIGNWEPVQLEKEFKRKVTSWPFVKDYNLFFLPNFDAEEIFTTLRTKNLENGPKRIHAQYLLELTNGDPWCVTQIISSMKAYTCDEIYNKSIELAQSEPFYSKVALKIKGLSSNARKYLENLLLGMKVYSNGHTDITNELVLSGLCHLVKRSGNELIEIKNWIIENAIRGKSCHDPEIGMDRIFNNFYELIPPITCINKEAYDITCEIENVLRNQVILRLYANQDDKDKHPLVGIYTYKNMAEWDNPNDDMFIRAGTWKKKVDSSRYVDTHSALIGFTNLPNLIEIMKKLIRENDPVFVKLKPYTDKFNALKDIRDAIAHNQLLSEQSYNFVGNLRDQLISSFCIK